MVARSAIIVGFSALLVAGAFAVNGQLSHESPPDAVQAAADARAQAVPEPAPAATKPADIKPEPAEPEPAQPVGVAPVEAKPVETKPVEAKPVEASPVEAMPSETKPADMKPAEIKPVEPPPTEAAAPTTPVVALPPAESVPMPPGRPSIAEQKDKLVSAKALFAAEKLPSLGKAMAIGYYPRGCLSGGVALPVNGPTWQVMRISRNRNWGHPSLVRYLEKFAPLAAKATGWKGILVGDMAQPRGGPTPFGHRSHQTGLDVDIWFMPMPGHVLSKTEREKTSAINLVAADWKHVNPKTWTPQHADFIRVAAEQPEVERVLVNAAIKKQMCRMQGKKHPDWMDKVRPWYAHHDHIHVRLKCPAGSPNCRKQPPVPGSDGCGKALDFWFSDRVLHPKRKKGGKPPRPVTLADMPPACKTVLAAPDRVSNN
ncbi:MAG: penicillin-insensitive murein endopeptidase [Pseudolabrys sp.]|nr:penicillin-insensitive murein endopeptidase [Pseudolabrys sp.]